MNLQRVRDLLKRGAIELDLSLPHALTEARKDGLTTDDLEVAVIAGELVEDYGEFCCSILYQTIGFHFT